MARFLLYGRGIRFWYLFRIGEKVKELPSAFSQPPQRGKTFEAGRSLRVDRRRPVDVTLFDSAFEVRL